MKNLLLLFTLFCSSSAYSQYYIVTTTSSYIQACFPKGLVFTPSDQPCVGHAPWGGDRKITSGYVSGGTYNFIIAGNHMSWDNRIYVTDAPEPDKGFCDSQEIQDAILQDQNSCDSSGGQFGYTCDDVTQNYSSTCTAKPPVCDENSPDWPSCADVPECSMGNVGYPACLWPPEPEIPDNPNIPPSGGDSGSGGGGTHDPTEPLDPNPEIPPVETLPPEEGNGNVLKAIADLNTDNNNLITRLNKDLNVGLSDVGSYLDVLNDNTIGLLELSRLGFDNINQSINNQNDVIRQSGNMTNNYLDTLTNVTGNGLQDVVDALGADKMVTPGSYIAPPLYSSHQMDTLDAEVAGLKIQYTNQLNEFKSYFNFKTDVNSGEYNAHTLKQRWGGQELSFDSFALKVFVDNANIIGLIIIFGFGMAGIRVILETI